MADRGTFRTHAQRWKFTLVFMLPCATAVGQSAAPFTEEAVARGVNYTVQYVSAFGCGLLFADLNNDGSPDLITLGRTGTGSPTVGVYENNGSGVFIDHRTTSGIPAIPQACGVSAGDYDGDGDLDLYITTYMAGQHLLRNDGNFTFTDVSAAAGVNDDGAGMGSSWADFDGDGRLDLYVANRTGSTMSNGEGSPVMNKLYHNLGNGTFVDVAPQHQVTGGESPSFQPGFFDYDRDGDADLYLSNDKGDSTHCGWRNMMWQNDGSTYVDVSASSGTDGCIDAMSTTIGDFDNNGYQDIYVTNNPIGNYLYLNQGDGTFVNRAEEAGVAGFHVGWGALMFDFDNDGWMDLYVCSVNTPNFLFDNNGTWPAMNVASQLGVALRANSYCVAAADIDNDGDVDFALSPTSSRIRLYINHEGERRRWAKFRVMGQDHNTWGVGTNIDVRTGAAWQLREVIAGSAFKSQDDLVVHFGMNEAQIMDEIHVVWPGGATRTLMNYPTNHTWTLYPPGRLGDTNADGVLDLVDFNALMDCVAASGSDEMQSGCEMMDFNGNSIIDDGDFDAFEALCTIPASDCDHNGVSDLRDIFLGHRADANRNARVDVCENAADMNCDGVKDGMDIEPFVVALEDAEMYSACWPGCDRMRADMNFDGRLNNFDINGFVDCLLGECP